MSTGEFNAEVNPVMASRFMPTETTISYLARLQTLIIQFATQTHPNNGFLSSAELVLTHHFTHLLLITAYI